MHPNGGVVRRRRREAGVSLVIVAGGLVVLLGMSALAIDLASFYVARNEAQRAADAAALAGASVFSNQGCVAAGGCVPGGPQEALATTQALAVAAQNPVFGQAPSGSTTLVGFTYPSSTEPQITVTVYRDSGHSNAMPTFFGKVFGISTTNISAKATAEAYPATGISCLRPFMVPNCDPDHEVANGDARQNPVCPQDAVTGLYPSYFINPNTSPPSILNPGVYVPGPPVTGGVIGEPWTLHTGAGPSQWYMIAFTGQGASISNGLGSYIATCAPLTISCGTQQTSYNGATAGPVAAGVESLIHASGDCQAGQDTICSPTAPSWNSSQPICSTIPFTITGGANNPNPNLVGKTYPGPSDSLMSVAIYDGSNLGSGGSAVTVLGWMQMFVTGVSKSPGNPCSGSGKDINVVVMSVSACGPTGGINAQGTPIPIRLIRQ